MAIHTTLPIYREAYRLFDVIMDLTKNMPREFKQSIGGKLRDECIEIMTLIFRANPQRMGPLTLEAREWALAEILRIQAECNAARPERLPALSLIDAEEEARIRELIAAGTWPDGWEGDEPRADEFLPVTVYANGAEQHDLFGLEAA